MKHPEPGDDLLVHLYLGAVLPSLSELVELDPVAREAAGRAPWEVTLAAPGGASARVAFDGEQIIARADECRGLLLRFVSRKHAIRTFGGGTWLPPIPAGGWWHIGDAKPFSRLTERLATIMDPTTPNGDTRARLLFGGLAARALAELCDGQADAGQLAGRFGAFVAQFTVSGDVSSWLMRREDGTCVAGSGSPPGDTTVALEFADVRTARLAADGDLDQLGAIGAGELRVEGLTPLADTLDILLDRIASYLT